MIIFRGAMVADVNEKSFLLRSSSQYLLSMLLWTALLSQAMEKPQMLG
jgi:hypothetical protein